MIILSVKLVFVSLRLIVPLVKLNCFILTVIGISVIATDCSLQECGMCYCGLVNFSIHMGLDARQPAFGSLRITKAQTSLRIRAD